MADHVETGSTKTAYGRFSRRLRAFVIDWIIILLLLVMALFAAVSANSDSVGRVLGFTLVAVWLLYEPILVCLTGSTVGHYVCNLRVVDDRSHSNISFLKAAARLVIKTLLGPYSFITMATTSRHQAVHDLLTRSTVQIRDRSKAIFSEYVVENTELPSPMMPSRMLRTVIILCYLFASFTTFAILLRLLISEPCFSSRQCSSIETATKTIYALILLASIPLFIIQGWRGRLYGCRAGKAKSHSIVTPQGMKVWDRAATLGFAILAVVLGGVLLAFVRRAIPALAALKPFDLAHDGTALAIGTLVVTPVQTVTLVWAARLTGTDILTYFGLIVPRWRATAVAVAALASFIVLGDILIFAIGHDIVPPVMLDEYRSARADGTLVWLWLAVIVVAPIGEELMFRGFLFRGFVHEPCNGLHGLPGILVIALIWPLLHIQYDWVGVGTLFAVGVMLGYVRLYTGSTILAILLHMLNNLEGTGETVVVLGGV
jgi:membrane protease YdiL (CAAX protease family)